MIRFESVDQLRKSLPSRDNFLNLKLKKVIKNRVSRKQSINFLSNDSIETHISINRKHSYAILLFGILPDGSRATVVLENIDVYFDILVQDGAVVKDFSTQLRLDLQRQGLSADETEIVYKFPFHGHNEKEKPFIRLHYNALYNYKKALRYVLDETKYDTASNDLSCYYRKVAREYKYNTAGMNMISKYKLDTSGSIATTEYVLRVNINNIKSYDIKDTDADCLKRDYTLKCGWDIESHTIPSERDGFVYVDRPDRDKVFMICMSFNWYHDPTPIYDITLTTMPCTDNPEAPTILCRNQIELFKAMAVVLGRLQPDLLTGFNDGGYDFPMILNRMPKQVHDFWKEEISAVPATERNLQYMIKGRHMEKKIKISADTMIDREVFKVPGMTVFDTQMAFQKIYPTAEGKSLDFFLKECRLPLKNEMAISHMFKLLDSLYEIQRIIEWNSETSPLLDLDELFMLIEEKCPDNATEIIERLRELDDIREYCRVDAKRCPELCVARTVIGDTREKSTMSYTTLHDGLYRADGMKVRNLAMAIGYDNGVVFNTIGNHVRRVKNYPGGFVFPPKKGLKKFTQAEKILFKLVEDLPDWRERLEKLDVRRIYDEESARKTLSEAGMESLIERWITLMKTIKYDRPATGLDFSSLYPSLIMTYNFSPDKCIKSAKQAAEMDPADLMPVEFIYEKNLPGGGSADATAKGWFVKHHNDPSRMGLYVIILRDLFNKRSVIKKVMLMLKSVAEFMEEAGSNDIPLTELVDIANEHVKTAETNPDLSAKHRRTRERAEFKLKGARDIHKYLVEHVDETFTGLLRDLEFEVKKLNSKQLALKLFMNTFYGEAGNQISPFYELLVSGSICNKGQYNIKMVDNKVRTLDCDVGYGDTDSVYVSSPHSVFREADKAYALSEIDREEYWTQMVDITMDNIDEVKTEVNDMLRQDNGSPFLKVAYEEVLWPYYLAAKKKYLGNPHENLVQKSLWYALDMSLADFAKKLFLRGMDAKKRGSSGFLKECCFSLWRELMDIREIKPAMKATTDYVGKIMFVDWSSRKDLFVKRARYKKAAPGKPGNKSVLTFIKRMTERGVPIPEVGDRFGYVLVKPNNIQHDLRGRKISLKVGDIMEFPEVLDDSRYEINMDYYMLNEIVGQFARMIVYHEQFDAFDDNGDPDDGRSIVLAKNYLQKYYKANYVDSMLAPVEYKAKFRAVNKSLLSECDEIFGDSADIFKTLNVAITGSDKTGTDFDREMLKALDVCINKKAIDMATKHDLELAKYLRSNRANLMTLRKIYNDKIDGVIAVRRRMYEAKYTTAYKRLIAHLIKFAKICDMIRCTLRDFIENEVSINLTGLDERDMKIIDEMSEALNDAIAYKKCIKEDELFIQRIELIIDSRNGGGVPDRKAKFKFTNPMKEYMMARTDNNIMDISGV